LNDTEYGCRVNLIFSNDKIQHCNIMAKFVMLHILPSLCTVYWIFPVNPISKYFSTLF
jgi:hypothetical protein